MSAMDGFVCQLSSLRSRMTSLSCCCETNLYAPVPMGWRQKSLPLPEGTTPSAPSERFHNRNGSGLLRCTTQVSGSGVSTWSTWMKEPDFAVMTVPLCAESMDHLASAEVSGFSSSTLHTERQSE